MITKPLSPPIAFSVAKRGNSDEENEDRYSRRRRKNSFMAMSDGATEASYSGEWAELLVNSPWNSLLPSHRHSELSIASEASVRTWLVPLRQKFNVSRANSSSTWYAVAKARQGSFATFLGFRMSPNGRWLAVSCGDTCLVKVVNGQIADSFPIRNASEFGNQPKLVSSKLDAPFPEMNIQSGQTEDGDEVFVLATDALAAWLLDDDSQNIRLGKLLDCKSNREFYDLVSAERVEGRLKNDDTTALVQRIKS